MTTERDNQTILMVVTADFDEALRRMATETGTSRAEVIQRAVNLYRQALDARIGGKKLLVADEETEQEIILS